MVQAYSWVYSKSEISAFNSPGLSPWGRRSGRGEAPGASNTRIPRIPASPEMRMIPPTPKGAPAADQEFGLSIFEKFPPATARACPHEGAAAAGAKPPGSVMSEVKQFIRMVPPPRRASCRWIRNLVCRLFRKISSPNNHGRSLCFAGSAQRPGRSPGSVER